MKKYLLLIILLSAFILRTYNVAKVPPALSWDEVSIGYNAYSILKTGYDEHGKVLPLDAFAAYGDYKPPLPIYAAVPFIAVFGLTDLAVRLPSALFGTLTVLLTYFLVGALIKQKSDVLPVLSAAVLSVSPWHVNLSRGGFEANIALFFAVLGVWFVLKARTHPVYWLFAWLPFTAAIYTFNSARIFVVLLAPALVLFTLADIKKNVRGFILGVIIAALFMAPILPHLFSKEARLRFAEVNIFTDQSVVETSNTRIDRGGTGILSKIVSNRRVGYARSFLLHFMDNLEPDFLFVKGDGNPKFSIRDVGELYLIEAPFLVVGIFSLLIEYPAIAGLLLYWIIAAIIPAATARETPHALRILNSLPVWHIFIAFGILSVYRYVKKGKIIYLILISLLYLFSITYYLHTYYRHYPVEYSGEWQYGYREALARISPIALNYNKIVMTDSIGRPYMYALFYTKTDPGDFLRSKISFFDAAGFYHVTGFLKYRFGGSLPNVLEPKTLYIWNGAPKGARILDTIHLLNGDPVLEVFDNGGVKL